MQLRAFQGIIHHDFFNSIIQHVLNIDDALFVALPETIDFRALIGCRLSLIASRSPALWTRGLERHVKFR